MIFSIITHDVVSENRRRIEVSYGYLSCSLVALFVVTPAMLFCIVCSRLCTTLTDVLSLHPFYIYLQKSSESVCCIGGLGQWGAMGCPFGTCGKIRQNPWALSLGPIQKGSELYVRNRVPLHTNSSRCIRALHNFGTSFYDRITLNPVMTSPPWRLRQSRGQDRRLAR